jgi:hypothetical protein
MPVIHTRGQLFTISVDIPTAFVHTSAARSRPADQGYAPSEPVRGRALARYDAQAFERDACLCAKTPRR